MAEEVLQRTITQAPDYLKPGIEKFLELSTAQAAQPIDTSQFAPSVVGLGQLQQQAQQQAATQAGLGTLQFDPTSGAVSGVQGTGVAGFQPFLDTAQKTLGGVQPFIDAAGKDFQTQAGLTGPTAFQAFESPYQSAVRDATLSSFQEQADVRRQALRDQQAQLGVLGAGRAGVQLAEYDRKSDMDRALLEAQLNQAGFTQANQLAAQAFGQRGQLGAQQGQLAGLQSGLANQQLGLATTQPQLAAGAIGMAQGVGQGDLAYRQAVQDAQQGGNRMAAFEPIERLARFGQGLTGVGGGLGSVQTTMGTPPPQQSPLAGALQAGIGAFSLGKLFG
jgi:hypothetical protein